MLWHGQGDVPHRASQRTAICTYGATCVSASPYPAQNNEDWAALHDILAFDSQVPAGARKQRSVTVKGKTRDRYDT